MFGLGEAIKLANSQSLNMEKFYEVLSTSTASCWALNNYTPIKGVGVQSPADNHFKPGFSSQLMLKDLSLALSDMRNSAKNVTYLSEIIYRVSSHESGKGEDILDGFIKLLDKCDLNLKSVTSLYKKDYYGRVKKY